MVTHYPPYRADRSKLIRIWGEQRGSCSCQAVLFPEGDTEIGFPSVKKSTGKREGRERGERERGRERVRERREGERERD